MTGSGMNMEDMPSEQEESAVKVSPVAQSTPKVATISPAEGQRRQARQGAREKREGRDRRVHGRDRLRVTDVRGVRGDVRETRQACEGRRR
jgi:hypothetical protein